MFRKIPNEYYDNTFFRNFSWISGELQMQFNFSQLSFLKQNSTQ